jgi:hypothetical protein
MDAMQYHSIPIVEKQIQIRSMHMVDERRAGGGSLVSLWLMTKELAEQKFSPPSTKQRGGG